MRCSPKAPSIVGSTRRQRQRRRIWRGRAPPAGSARHWNRDYSQPALAVAALAAAAAAAASIPGPPIACTATVALAALVPQADRAQGEALDGALSLAAIDVLADPEGVVGEIEQPRHDVVDQGLAAERDGEAEHRGAGDEGGDADAEAGEDGEPG